MIELNPMTCVRPRTGPDPVEFTAEADRGTVIVTLEALDLWAIARVTPAAARVFALALARMADAAERQGVRAGGKGGGE